MQPTSYLPWPFEKSVFASFNLLLKSCLQNVTWHEKKGLAILRIQNIPHYSIATYLTFCVSYASSVSCIALPIASDIHFIGNLESYEISKYKKWSNFMRT